MCLKLLISAVVVQVPGFTLPGSGNGQEAVSAASKAVRDAALNALYNVSVPGASGTISFESYTNSVQVRLPIQTCIHRALLTTLGRKCGRVSLMVSRLSLRAGAVYQGLYH